MDDPLEAEADAVAGAPAARAAVARDAPPTEAPAAVHEVLRSPGQPLDGETRAFMEARLGHDFSRVRVHADEAAGRSAGEIGAHAYTVGDDVVFAPDRFAPETAPGRTLLAHELAHVARQNGEAVVRRQAAGEPAGVQPELDPDSPDDWIWALETFRRRSPQAFVRHLAANEGLFYPLLRPYGFRGSWVKDDAYLDDFDAAVHRWGKSRRYVQRFGQPREKAPPPKPKSREERRYEAAQMLVLDFTRHGRGRGYVNDALERAGLLDDLESHGFEKAPKWSFTDSEAYENRAVDALNAYVDRYRSAHDIALQTMGVPAQGEDVEFYRTWLEGLGYVTGSFVGAGFAEVASFFTDDPKKITAAAGLGAAVEGAAGSVFLGRGSYAPEVVRGRDAPPAAVASRYAGAQPVEPVRDPATVAAPPVREPVPPPVTEPPPKEPPAPAPAERPARAPRKNPPIDTKRQLQAKARLEQTRTELQVASREQASAEQSLLSAQSRVKALTDERPAVPRRLESARRSILAVTGADAEERLGKRLDLVNEVRASRDDWSAEEKEWLDHQAALLDAQLDVEASRAGREKQRETVRDARILEPVRRQELARASKSIAELIRSDGPNRRAIARSVGYDEIMGEEAWNALRARRPEGAPPPTLNTDHIVPVREIRDMVVESGLMELYDRASPAVKEQIENAIGDLGDERENLVRMEATANQTWKSDRSWLDIRNDTVSSLYTPAMVDAIRAREQSLREHYRRAIRELVTRFGK